MPEVQFSIFDIPLAPEPTKEAEILPAPPVDEPQEEPQNEGEFDFDCTVPEQITNMPILRLGEKVVIIPAKYGHVEKVPGIIKTFLPTTGEIVVRRRDGEGSYQRYELYKA